MSAVFASVDLGGTNIKCALARADGVILRARSAPTESHLGSTAVLEKIAKLVDGLCQETSTRPAALGMAVPGLVDLRAGVTKFLPNFPTQWREVPARKILSSKLGYPVYLLNDVRTAALGELTFGHGRSSRTFAFFAVG